MNKVCSLLSYNEQSVFLIILVYSDKEMCNDKILCKNATAISKSIIYWQWNVGEAPKYCSPYPSISRPYCGYHMAMLCARLQTDPSVKNGCCWQFPDSNVHGANMGPTWVLSAPDGPHVGPMNLAIRIVLWWPDPPVQLRRLVMLDAVT